MPVKWLWWRVVEIMFRGQFCLCGNDVPKHDISIDVFNGGQILNYEYRDMLRSKKVKAVRGAIHEFKENSVVLVDGTELEADLVLYGTGFTKSFDYLDSLL